MHKVASEESRSEAVTPPRGGRGEGGGGGEAAGVSPACQAALRESLASLETAGRWHALALMRAARNHLDEALAIWKGLAEGSLIVSLVCVG